MKLLTKKALAREVAASWKSWYKRKDGTWYEYKATSKLTIEEVYYQLLELGEDPNYLDVEEILEGDRCTFLPACSECETLKEALVEIECTEEEGGSSVVCLDCLKKAVKLLEQNTLED